jgi:hypothetical protein
MTNETPWLDADGGLIAGIYHDCPEPVYRRLPALNWSRVKVAALKSLSAAKRDADDADAGISTDTAGRAMNRLVHALVLDAAAVKSEFVRSEHPAFRTNDAKAYKEALRVDGITPITEKAWTAVESAAGIIRSHAGTAHMLTVGRGEVVAIARMDVRLPSGVVAPTWVKCKVDLLWMTTNGFYVGDLKACSDTEPDAFVRVDAAKNGYHGQLDLYATIVRLAMLQSGTATDDPRAAMLRPYWITHHEPTSRVCLIPCATQREIDDGLGEHEPSEMQLAGRALWQHAFSIYVEAQMSGEWPQKHDQRAMHAPKSFPAYAPGMGMDTWDEMDAERVGGDDDER